MKKKEYKVYCIDCIYYRDCHGIPLCEAPENLIKEDNWLGKPKLISSPQELNKNNDCKFYCDKYPSSFF